MAYDPSHPLRLRVLGCMAASRTPGVVYTWAVARRYFVGFSDAWGRSVKWASESLGVLILLPSGGAWYTSLQMSDVDLSTSSVGQQEQRMNQAEAFAACVLLHTFAE